MAPEALGAQNRLLRYGRDIRCAEQPPVVRDASSVRETAPALFVRSGGPFPCYFDGTRYRRGPPMVRNMRAVLKKASWGTRRIFGSTRCSKQAPVVQKRYSVHENPLFLHGRRSFRGTRCSKQASPVRKRYSVRRTASSGTRRIFGARNGPRSLCSLRRPLPLLLRRHSVPERASYGTEYACRAQKGFLGYAMRFQRHSVRKTGSCGTEEIFGV